MSFGYVPAEEYDKDHDWESVWLSSGVRDIRAVIGYEGVSRPGGMHLILLNGFETERAKAVISRLEPTSLSLARTDTKGSTHAKFESVQRAVREEIERYLATPPEYVDIFPKSCSETYESLKAHVGSLLVAGVRNICIAPMNTKASSLAAFLYACENSAVQVIYAEPQQYNTEHYAKAQAGFYEIAIS